MATRKQRQEMFQRKMSWSEDSSQDDDPDDPEEDPEDYDITFRRLEQHQDLEACIKEICTQKRMKQENRITEKLLRDVCRENQLYLLPRLNTVLYLNHRGFHMIESLEKYTGLKTLWLENNNIKVIQNISHLKELKCLFLQNNQVEKIENLDGCPLLTHLNLANNFVSQLQHLAHLNHLHTLNLSRNKLRTKEDVLELKKCAELANLDVSYNCLDDPDIVEDVFGCMPNLKVLVLMGNPLVRKMSEYRRTLILTLKHLTYLDTRPVHEKDKQLAEAWSEGGLEAEAALREQLKQEEHEKMMTGVRHLIQIRDANLAQRGIDGSSEEDQLRAIEQRGLELKRQQREQMKTKVEEWNCPEQLKAACLKEAEDNLEPILNSYIQMQSYLDTDQDHGKFDLNSTDPEPESSPASTCSTTMISDPNPDLKAEVGDGQLSGESETGTVASDWDQDLLRVLRSLTSGPEAIDRTSDHYVQLKERMLQCRRDRISRKKKGDDQKPDVDKESLFGDETMRIRDSEQMLHNSTMFYEKYLALKKPPDTETGLEQDDDDDDHEEDEEAVVRDKDETSIQRILDETTMEFKEYISSQKMIHKVDNLTLMDPDESLSDSGSFLNIVEHQEQDQGDQPVLQATPFIEVLK